MSVTAQSEQQRLEMLKHRCTRCHQIKAWSEFQADRKTPDGTVLAVNPICKPCRVKLSADWVERNREKRRAYAREWMRRKRSGSTRKYVLLDAAPLREFLLADDREEQVIADASGISQRTIRAILRCERPTVELSTADQIITRLGGTFCLLYPVEDER